MNWFLIPASPENIDRSIRNPVSLSDLIPFLGEAESKRLAALGDGELRCWAMSSGIKVQFDKMRPGDLVLISESGTKKFNYFAEVTATITSKGLGNYLWSVKPRKSPETGKRTTWDFIYFLKNLRSIDVRKEDLVLRLGRQARDYVVGARQIDSEALALFEDVNGPLLEWLRKNAKLDWPVQPEPLVTLPPQPILGKAYTPATTTLTYEAHEQVFTYNSEKVERGKAGHVTTQNALAKFLQKSGHAPRSSDGEPDFDLAWMVGETLFVAEVKSTTEENEEHQLRLGLGQVLRYRHKLAGRGRRVIAVLVPEKKPSDESWLELCQTLGVYIGWPGSFERLLAPTN